jgi:hypothetical protein
MSESAEEPTIPAPRPTVDPVRPEGQGWTVGKWSGLDNYECVDCSFSTLDLPLIQDHRVKVHAPPSDKPAAEPKRRYVRRS